MLVNPTIKPEYKQEIKGLDMVRRDWSILSKNVSEHGLKQILSGQSIENVIEKVGEHLTSIKNKMEKN